MDSAIRIITKEARLTFDEHRELGMLYDTVTENGRYDNSSFHMWRNMMKTMDSRLWALLDKRCYNFDMGPGPEYPINCYRQSFMGWVLPES